MPTDTEGCARRVGFPREARRACTRAYWTTSNGNCDGSCAYSCCGRRRFWLRSSPRFPLMSPAPARLTPGSTSIDTGPPISEQELDAASAPKTRVVCCNLTSAIPQASRLRARARRETAPCKPARRSIRELQPDRIKTPRMLIRGAWQTVCPRRTIDPPV
jgi:hypothetical protein